MIDDSERREVAARLRKLEISVTGTVVTTHTLAKNILDAIKYGHSDAMTPYGLLADLIEPDEPKVKCVAEVKVDGERLEELVHDAAVELTGIDRDALLELADDLERMGDGSMYDASISDEYGIARRIREALGVQDA